MKVGRVSYPSSYLAMLAIDAGAIAAYTGSDWDDAQDADVGDTGRAFAAIERGRSTLKVGTGTGVLAEIGGCGVAEVYRFGTTLVIPEHYTGDVAPDPTTFATHPTTKPRKLGTVDVPSGVLVLKGLYEPGTKIPLAKARRGPLELRDGVALPVSPGKYDVWKEQFKREPRGAWGSMPSRTRIVPAGTRLKEGAPIAELTPRPSRRVSRR